MSMPPPTMRAKVRANVGRPRAGSEPSHRARPALGTRDLGAGVWIFMVPSRSDPMPLGAKLHGVDEVALPTAIRLRPMHSITVVWLAGLGSWRRRCRRAADSRHEQRQFPPRSRPSRLVEADERTRPNPGQPSCHGTNRPVAATSSRRRRTLAHRAIRMGIRGAGRPERRPASERRRPRTERSTQTNPPRSSATGPDT